MLNTKPFFLPKIFISISYFHKGGIYYPKCTPNKITAMSSKRQRHSRSPPYRRRTGQGTPAMACVSELVESGMPKHGCAKYLRPIWQHINTSTTGEQRVWPSSSFSPTACFRISKTGAVLCRIGQDTLTSRHRSAIVVF